MKVALAENNSLSLLAGRRDWPLVAPGKKEALPKAQTWTSGGWRLWVFVGNRRPDRGLGIISHYSEVHFGLGAYAILN